MQNKKKDKKILIQCKESIQAKTFIRKYRVGLLIDCMKAFIEKLLPLYQEEGLITLKIEIASNLKVR